MLCNKRLIKTLCIYNQLNKDIMNNVGEVINVSEKSNGCREFNPKETIAQLKGNNPIKYMCWGATDFKVDNKQRCTMLCFNVSGMLHKGLVYIFVNASDLYDVYIVSNKGLIKDVGTDLYFDMITDYIDGQIERVSSYSF